METQRLRRAAPSKRGTRPSRNRTGSESERPVIFERSELSGTPRDGSEEGRAFDPQP